MLAGLVCRYLLKLRAAGAALLFCTPLIDVALLVATAIDLRGGAEADFTHGLAAIYIGVSIVYGHSMIRWADVRFAHRFAGGPAPAKPAKYGEEHARRERQGWFRHLAAWAIGCAILYGMTVWIDAADRTQSLVQIIRGWSGVLGIDFLISFSYTLFPRRRKDSARTP
ncbi:putative membrane protein YmcC [Cohnella xylanilytica]|uniref:hypothetical protein n=1 Tax=Cohnella xylanilytica TaxID=557555 RepID=UPI001B035FC7|nr:hypothetical protein [Cohnella xylanilytica]GIO14694.1 putative membrane protein YmcC [Cohnella xylanilytica]